MLGTAAEQKAIIDKCETRLTGLHEQMEKDYSRIRLEDFVMPETSGTWENFTANSPATLTGSLLETLTEAWLKLSIVPTEVVKAKSKIGKSRTMTEQLANGAIWTANQRLLTIPEGQALQPGIAWNALWRGGSAVLCYLYTEEVHGEKKLIPHIVAWDLLNTFWVSGTNGLLWAGFKHYGSKEQLEEEYEGALPDEERGVLGIGSIGNENKEGQVCVYNVWDKEEEGEFCGDEWIKKEKHNLDYIPIHILRAGAVPIVQSGEITDTLKDAFQSAIARNRRIYDEENELLTYKKTRAKLEAKPAIKNMFDSTDGGAPVESVKDLNVSGLNIPLDAKQGQDLVPFVPAAVPSPNIDQLWAEVNRQKGQGGIAPIALGFSEYAQTASGISQLTEASRHTLYPYAHNIEGQFEWIGEEVARQYKHGKFDETEFEGYQANGKKFKVLIQPDQINDNEHFEAELQLEKLRDKMGMMGFYIEGLKAGFFSRRKGQEEFNDDPDLAESQINLDKVSVELGLPLWSFFEDMTTDEQGNTLTIEQIKKAGNWLAVQSAMNRLYQMAQPPGGNGGAEQIPGRTAVALPRPEPATNVGMIAAEPATEISRLNKIGLTFAKR